MYPFITLPNFSSFLPTIPRHRPSLPPSRQRKNLVKLSPKGTRPVAIYKSVEHWESWSWLVWLVIFSEAGSSFRRVSRGRTKGIRVISLVVREKAWCFAVCNTDSLVKFMPKFESFVPSHCSFQEGRGITLNSFTSRRRKCLLLCFALLSAGFGEGFVRIFCPRSLLIHSGSVYQ